MKEILLQLATHNIWANSSLLATIEQLSEEKQKQEISSSFPSLYKTVLHMWDAESIWFQRVKLLDRLNIPSQNFNGDMKELGQALLLQNKLWYEWINGNQEYMLQHVFQYQNFKREQFKQPVYQMLLHIFNHGTYHRGQLVTLLRQLGVENIPATDFIVWSRKQKGQVTSY